jgi:hypothetical protein
MPATLGIRTPESSYDDGLDLLQCTATATTMSLKRAAVRCLRSSLRIRNVGNNIGSAHERASSKYIVDIKHVRKQDTRYGDITLLSFCDSKYLSSSHDVAMLIRYAADMRGRRGSCYSESLHS